LDLPKSLRLIQNKWTRFYTCFLNGRDLTLPQFTLLLLVADEGPLPMGEIARKLYLASSSVTHLVDQLEMKKMIERKQNHKDRRSYRICLLKKGEEIVEQVRRFTVDRLSSEVREWPESEMRTVGKFFETMTRVVDRLIDETSVKGPRP